MAGELFSDPSVIRSTILCHTKTLDTAGADSDVEFERQKSEMCQGSHGWLAHEHYGEKICRSNQPGLLQSCCFLNVYSVKWNLSKVYSLLLGL